ncbi:MAG: hypothetical protein R2932_42575 [Caldilineaceae bacterium]
MEAPGIAESKDLAFECYQPQYSLGVDIEEEIGLVCELKEGVANVWSPGSVVVSHRQIQAR